MRLIDADNLMAELNKIVYTKRADTVDRHTLQIVSAIQNAPKVDAVEVVRCKDCMHFYNPAMQDFRCNLHNIYIYTKDYCSYGERKEE